jgi:hypothetical protein
MNNDDFEQKLHRTIRPVPLEWRREILNAASAAAPIENQKSKIKNTWWSVLLWPSPKAWAGLAAVWLAIFVFNLSSRDTSATLTAQSVPPSPELIMALREQRRTMARLIEPFEQPQAEPPKPFAPGPRGEVRPEIVFV